MISSFRFTRQMKNAPHFIQCIPYICIKTPQNTAKQFNHEFVVKLKYHDSIAASSRATLKFCVQTIAHQLIITCCQGI